METPQVKRKNSYQCAECGRPVLVNARGALVRECMHEEAGVIASVSATTYGVGSVRMKEVSAQ